MKSNSQNEKNGSETTNAVGNRKSVTVIGLGPMGQAMADVFLEYGYSLTVWNRTSSKADQLVAKGAIRVSTVNEALAANELVILSLTDYNVMYSILEPVSENLFGKVLVNLSSDTPEKARKAAKWLEDRGAWHITGGVQVPPSGIGKSESYTYYSGDRVVFEAHRRP